MEKVRRLAFRTALCASLAAYFLIAKLSVSAPHPTALDAPSAADDALGTLLVIVCGAFVLCAVFYGVATVRAYLEADDVRQREWEAERDASRAAGGTEPSA